MGFYIDIILRNSKTGEEKVVEFWSTASYSEAWRGAVEKGLHKLSDLWSPEGDDKYWFLVSLTDMTRR